MNLSDIYPEEQVESVRSAIARQLHLGFNHLMWADSPDWVLKAVQGRTDDLAECAIEVSQDDGFITLYFASADGENHESVDVILRDFIEAAKVPDSTIRDWILRAAFGSSYA